MGNTLVAIVLLVGIPVAFGVGGRALMRSKGRSGVSGFLLGLFLGIIGIVVCAVISDDRHATYGVSGGRR